MKFLLPFLQIRDLLLRLQDKFDDLSTQVNRLTSNLSTKVDNLSSELSLLQHRIPHVQDSCLKVKTESDDDEKKYIVSNSVPSCISYIKK